MPYFEGIYGYEISRKVKLSDLIIHPVYENFKTVKELARDTTNYFLTGIIEHKNESSEVSLFDLEGILAFIDRLDIIITNKNEFDSVNLAKAKTPSKLFLTGRQNGGGQLIASDNLFENNHRAKFISSAIDQLSEEKNNSVLRKAFFKTIEPFRARRPFLETSYYLYYSALELLARYDLQDRDSDSVDVISSFLRKFEFNLKENNSKDLIRAVSSYAHVRNALFHNSRHKTEIDLNEKMETFNINDFYSHLRLLVPLVILKYMGYDDGEIRWGSWYDRIPY